MRIYCLSQQECRNADHILLEAQRVGVDILTIPGSRVWCGSEVGVNISLGFGLGVGVRQSLGAQREI